MPLNLNIKVERLQLSKKIHSRNYLVARFPKSTRAKFNRMSFCGCLLSKSFLGSFGNMIVDSTTSDEATLTHLTGAFDPGSQ